MRITQRQATLGVIMILAGGCLLLLAVTLVQLALGVAVPVEQPVAAGIAFVVYIVFLFLYWRGHDYVRYLVLISNVLATVVATGPTYVSEHPSITLLMPAVLAMIVAGPIEIVASALATYLGLLIRAGGTGVYTDPITMLLFTMVTGGIVIGRLIADTAQRAALQNAARAEQALATTEQQARELAESNHLLEDQLNQQQRLLDLVTTLETPVIALAHGMLFAPIVGHVDTRRAQSLTNRLLHAAHEQRARLVVLDVTGVAMIDTAVARALTQMVQSLRLLGCDVAISGISAPIAATMVQMDLTFQDVTIVRSPQEALLRYIQASGAHA